MVTVTNKRFTRVWSLDSGTITHEFEVAFNKDQGLAFSPDGKRIAVEFSDNYIRVWNLPIKDYTHAFHKSTSPVPGSITFSFDGCQLAFGANSGTIQLWDVSTCKKATLITWRYLM